MKIYPSNLNHIRYTKPTNEEIQQKYNFPCSITVLNQALSTAELFYYDGEGNEFPQGRFNIPSDYLFQKALLKTDTAPTIKGLYPLSETGVYTNLGGIDAQSGKLNFASFDGTTWSLIAVDLPQPIFNNYINNNTYNLDPEQIVPSEALYSDETLAGDIIKRVDFNTGVNVNYRKTTTWHDGTAMTDDKVDGFIYKKINGDFFKRTSVDGISLLDFGAKGNGVDDDSNAIILASNYVKVTGDMLNVPDGYVFNLNNQTIDFTRVHIKFKGGVLKNGKLTGYHTKITAGQVQIFDNIELLGQYYHSASGAAYLQWFGLRQNDPSFDISDYYPLLAGKFKVVDLGEGLYFSIKGEMQIVGILKGSSEDGTIIEYRPSKNNTYLFSIGKYNGTLPERDYHRPSIENIGIYPMSEVRRTGITFISVGACSKSRIVNVKVLNNTPEFMFTEQDLKDFVLTRNPAKANIGLEFKGDSELVSISNFTAYSDIPVKIIGHNYPSAFIDFLQFNDCFLIANTNGIAAFYIASEAIECQNISFYGNNSFNQGLYGLYVEDLKDLNKGWGCLKNCSFKGIRVEQLNGNILNEQGEVEAKSIRLGFTNYYMNPIFSEIICAGSGAGFYIGGAQLGSVKLDNITITRDININVPYTFKVKNYLNSEKFTVFLNNIEERPDVGYPKLPYVLEGMTMYEESLNQTFGRIDSAKITKAPVENGSSITAFVGGVSYSKQHLKLENTESGQLIGTYLLKNDNEVNAVRYKIEVYILNRRNTIEFTLYKDWYCEVIKFDSGEKVFITTSGTASPNILNIMINESDKTASIINTLGGKALVIVDATILKI